MFPSIFTDELGVDIAEALPVLQSWGLRAVDLRGRVLGRALEDLDAPDLSKLKSLLDDYGMRVGCLESSLAKVHLPGPDRRAAEAAKLDRIIRAADALDCRLVRSFFYWQPSREEAGALVNDRARMDRVLEQFAPLAEKARSAGLILAFENCGVSPDEVLAFLDRLDVSGWGMAWDVHNDWANQERLRDESAYLSRLASRSKLVHVKAHGAVAGCDEPIPYDRVLRACYDAAMPGPVSAETHNPDTAVSDTEMSHRVVETIQKSWPSTAAGARVKATRIVIPARREWQDNPVGFAVVGLGKGRVRAREIQETPGARLIGVCDRDVERARKTGDELGVAYDTDLGRWLQDDRVEVVFVMTPTGLHAETALQALDAEKHVLITKPMEASLAACDALVRKAEEKNKLLAVDFERRFATDANTLKAAVSAGRLGRPLNGVFTLKLLRTMEYFRSGGGWRGTRSLDGGGVLSNQAIHCMDEIAFTLGIPARVQCNIWTQAHDIEAEDLGVATWVYESGLVVIFSATSSYPQATYFYQQEVVGQEGSYFQASGGPFDGIQTKWFLDGAWTTEGPAPVESEWLNSMDNMAAAVRTGAPLSCSGREARRTQAILHAMYQSAYDHNGGWVKVRPEVE